MLAPAIKVPEKTKVDLEGKIQRRPLEMKQRPKFVWRVERCLPAVRPFGMQVDEIPVRGIRPGMMLVYRIEGRAEAIMECGIVGVGCWTDDLLYLRRHNPTANTLDNHQVELIVVAL